ncbi:glutaredoxin family protein [Marinobacter sp. X15-166B]|uniref:glutaredoxin family protein n=1 Tax=Marinobacter sp. X15-166B TaxID=1897620 RepID=UPI00085CE041|nr:glutaredoxin [Marinobacter sp. X15-166B]OEY65357.1 glutaredoxin [Marinobacter sp. X15-166B]
MRMFIRYFFRTLRLILTPFMLLSEKLTTPKPVQRPPEEQQAVDVACSQLALYQFRTCPFCIKVRKEIARLGLTIEIRDAQFDGEHRQALEQGGGRIKVPCLLIEQDNGAPQWLYESSDINAWLRARFEPQPLSSAG